jgi:hypothetical protein
MLTGFIRLGMYCSVDHGGGLVKTAMNLGVWIPPFGEEFLE